MIILVEIKLLKGFLWKCVKCVVVITEWNNLPLMKDIGHFQQKKNLQVKLKTLYSLLLHLISLLIDICGR